MRKEYWAVLLRFGFEPNGRALCDWRRSGTIGGEVERVWISGVDQTFRTYRVGEVGIGHGKGAWELESLL